MRGTPRKNLSLFEAICGPDALCNVVLTTTMWDQVEDETGKNREDQLRTQFWESMLCCGSRMARFHRTVESAWEIIDSFSGHTRRPLQLQKETVDEGRKFNQTSPFQALFKWWESVVNKLRKKDLRGLQNNSSVTIVAIEEHAEVRREYGMAGKYTSDWDSDNSISASRRPKNKSRSSLRRMFPIRRHGETDQ
jgi:hypothetical protein